MTSTATDQINGFSGSLALKQPVRLATLVDIVLEGLIAIDGIVPAEGDRVLVKAQATPSQNGIYIASTGVWSRAVDFDATGKVVKGTQVWVTDGATLAGTLWLVSAANPVIVDTSALTWQAGTVYQAAAAMAVAIAGAANKATPVAADQFGYVNQADGTLRQFSWTQMLTALAVTFLPLAGGTLTGSLLLDDTTDVAAAPPLAFDGDANTGIGHPGADRLAFITAGVQRAEFTAAGALDLLSGQMKFPATANPSSDPNTLDDYEEGTWTPTMTFGGSSTGVTYGTQDGRYVKIGSMVWLGIRVTLTNNGSGTGQCVITSLPFTSLNAGAAALGCFVAEYWVGTTGVVGNLLAIIGSNSTSAGMRMSSGTNTVDVSDTVIGNTATVYLDGWYRAAA